MPLLPGTIAELRKGFAEGTPIRLMFQDEAHFGHTDDLRRAWAPRPIRPLSAMLTHEYTCGYAAVDVATGELDSLILPRVNAPCMRLLPETAFVFPD